MRPLTAPRNYEASWLEQRPFVSFMNLVAPPPPPQLPPKGIIAQSPWDGLGPRSDLEPKDQKR